MTGISGTNTEQAMERFCNEVASGFLLSHRELADLRITNDTPQNEVIQRLSNFAGTRHVSRRMVAYALFRAGILSQATWSRLDHTLHELWHKEQAARKQRDKSNDNRPSYYVVRRHRLGQALLNFVDRSIGAGQLTPVKAAKVLGVKPRSVYPLLEKPGRFGTTGTAGSGG